MQPPAIPPDELKRVEALTELEILDTAPEESYDQLTTLASQIAETPIALISLVDPTRQWFKAKVGLDAEETSREISFCGHAVHSSTPFVVQDAALDPRFSDNPLVTGAPHIRFYMGFPLETKEGYRLGTLCVIDRKPRLLDKEKSNQLSLIAAQIVRLFETRRLARRYQKQLRETLALTHQKSLFLAALSHEIRNPLNAIVGLTELLLDPIHREEGRESITYIRETCTTIARQLEDLLDHSRMSYGNFELEAIEFDLQTTIQRIAETYRIIAGKKGIVLNTEIAPNLPTWFTGDPVRIEQIITNLTGNAIKFTSEGSVTLSLRDGGEVDGGHRLCFAVSDTGPGIKQDRLEIIFQPFSQEQTSTYRRHGGSGLGLAICRSLVNLMGGELSVESEIGSGSCFSFEITLPPAKAPKPHSLLNTPLMEPKRLLLIEDNPVNQKVTQRLLRRKGHDTVVASTGEEAVGQFTEHHFDAVLADFHLPDYDGFSLIQAFREIEKKQGVKQTPIIILSGETKLEKSYAWHTVAVRYFLEKPVNLEDLERVLNEALAKLEEFAG